MLPLKASVLLKHGEPQPILYAPFNFRLGNRPSRTGGLQVETPRVNYKVGKKSAQYRGPVTWNFIARLANFNANIQKDSFKNILRRFSQNINSFPFEASMIAMKDRDFVYFSVLLHCM